MGKRLLLACWLALALVTVRGAAADPGTVPERGAEAPVAEQATDPVELFNRLVRRYRSLYTYRDFSTIVEVTERAGESPRRVRTNIACAIQDGEMNVVTPARQVWRGLDIFVPIDPIPIAEDARRRFNFWIAPHLTMKYAEQPLLEFRAGVEQGFTATAAEPVTIDDRPLVHLTLTSSDEAPEHEATFNLFIDPESLLIERIKGKQRLPDGASYQTTIDIHPVHSEIRAMASSGEPESEECEASATEQAAPVGADVPSGPARGMASPAVPDAPPGVGGM